jgi:soluble lytic murein transglycosylase-like protein
MTLAEQLALVSPFAIKYNLEPALIAAVIEQESGWNPWAIRYEPEFYARYVQPLGLSNLTEARARAFSWGAMQVMGQVAREHAYAGPLPQLCDWATGLDVGCTVLSYKLTKAQRDVPTALQLWNGGGNPTYAKEVMARMPRYA